MALLLDTGIVYAYYDRADDWHRRSRALLEQEAGALIIPAPVIPETDHLLGGRLGQAACQVFYRGLAEGFFFIADLAEEDYSRVAELNRQYADLKLGFVDAAVIAAAESLGLGRIATTDRRDFGAVRAKLSLQLLP